MQDRPILVIGATGKTGRRVATLVDGARAPGDYRVTWDGRDRDGRQQQPLLRSVLRASARKDPLRLCAA